MYVQGAAAGPAVVGSRNYYSYGAAARNYDGQDAGAPLKPAPFGRAPRRATNLLAVCAALLLPFALFAAVFSLQSFAVHHTSPGICNGGCAAAMLVVLAFGYSAVQAWRRRADGNQDPGWYSFLFVTGLAAWITGYVLGDSNFSANLAPYFSLASMNVYAGIDPSQTKGQQMMDAGRIHFAEGSHLDLSKSMGFRNMDIYCVAPIVGNSSGGAASSSYDFWAVGTNCCSHSGNFRCGEYNNPRAASGLRLARDGDAAFFRLAVQQAEAAYNIRAPHPVFMHWMQDPSTELSSFQDDGYKFFLTGIVGFFIFQLVAVIAAVIMFSKLGL